MRVFGGLISCNGEDSLLLIALTKNHKLFVFTIVGVFVVVMMLVVVVMIVMIVVMMVMVMMSSLIVVVVMNVLRIVIHWVISWYSG